jgi:hypothetical protein
MNITLRRRRVSVLGIQFCLPRFKASDAVFAYTEGKIRVCNHAKDIIGGKFSSQKNSGLTKNLPCKSYTYTECVSV